MKPGAPRSVFWYVGLGALPPDFEFLPQKTKRAGSWRQPIKSTIGCGGADSLALSQAKGTDDLRPSNPASFAGFA